MSGPESEFVEAIRSVVRAMLPDAQLITGTVESVAIRRDDVTGLPKVTAVTVHCDDENLPCDFTDAVAAAAVAPGGIVGRPVLVSLAGAPLALALYSIGDQ